MSYEQPHCLYCRDTGKKLTGDTHSDYLDCGHCGAAQERGDMEVYANNLIAINRLQPADCGLLWCVHERARDIAYAEIVRLSKERNQAEARIVSSTDAFKRIAQAHHAALVAGNGDAGEIAKLADYLNPAAVSHETWRARAVELETTLFETLELLENTDGLSKNNVDNLCGEKADEIRNVLYFPASKTKPAEQLGWLKFEGDTVLIYGIRYAKELLQDFGYAMPLGQPFVIEKREQDGALTVRKIAPSDTDTAQAARIAELEAENANLRYELNAALSGGTVSVPAAASAPVAEKQPLKAESIDMPEFRKLADAYHCVSEQDQVEPTYDSMVAFIDSEIERQVKAAIATHQAADTDKLREAIMKLKPHYSHRGDEFGRGFVEGRTAAANLVSSTALQAPVREVPEGGKCLCLHCGQSMPRYIGAVASIENPKCALPAAPVQEPKP